MIYMVDSGRAPAGRKMRATIMARSVLGISQLSLQYRSLRQAVAGKTERGAVLVWRRKRPLCVPDGLCSPVSRLIVQTEADFQRLIDPVHRLFIQTAHVLLEPSFIDGSDLLEKNDRIPRQAAAGGVQLDMGGQTGLVLLTGDGGGDHGGTETVPYVVLYDQYGTNTALFRADHWAQIRVVNISSTDVQSYSHSCIQAFMEMSVFSRACNMPAGIF